MMGYNPNGTIRPEDGPAALEKAGYEACQNGGIERLLDSIIYLRMSGNESSANALADGMGRYQEEEAKTKTT